MRILFMGTSPFAVPSLDALVKAGHEIVAVVTQPDRPSGRGRGLHVSPVKEAALLLAVPLFQPEKIRTPESVEQVKSCEPLDTVVVAAFGQIIPQSILDIPKFGSINVHGSLLPKYRGAAPIQHAIMSGDTVTGVTTMLMDAGLDTGDILLQAETQIGPQETSGELMERLSRIGADLLIDTLERLERDEIQSIPQDGSQASVAKSLKREDGLIDWTRPAQDIVNLVRAFMPRPVAYTLLDGAQLKVLRAEASHSTAGTPAGAVMDVTSGAIVVAAGEGCVRILEVQPENRKRMSAGEFARGARITSGTHFGMADP